MLFLSAADRAGLNLFHSDGLGQISGLVHIQAFCHGQVIAHELKRDQKQLDVKPSCDCVVTVYNENEKHFIRYGLNQNNGEAATDTFVLHKDGSIYGPIDWDYDVITAITANPMDEMPLTIKGGVFTTMANHGESR